MSGTGKKVADVAFKAGKTIDWEGMAKLLVSDEARREFATLRRAFDDVNSQLQTKFSQEPQPIDWEYYRKGIGSRLVDMYKQAYDEMKMHALLRSRFQLMRPSKTPIYNIFSSNQSRTYISSLTKFQNHSYPTLLFQLPGKQPKNPIFFRNPSISSYSSRVYKGIIPRSLRKRINKRARAAAKPVLNEALFKASISQLPPRFTPEELHDVIALQDDPLVCLELFNWASQQHRFRHNVLTFHITIKKLGVARMYEEMDYVVNQVLAVPTIASEPLYNSMIYYFCEARKLVRAVNIYKHMSDCRKLDCRPTIRTYNILFGALLSRGHNSYINHMYMETMRCLFKQMVDDGIEPEIFCLNCMIKGYVLSLHVNDALRIFHQMGVTYKCQPNSFTYDYLIHGLCAQGRTQNAREICDKMKKSGFVPSSKSYNSLVNSLALEGEIDEAVKFLWETAENQRVADFITYRTLLDEMSRQKGTRQALRFLDKLQEMKLLKGDTYQKILYDLEDNSHNAYDVDSGKCS